MTKARRQHVHAVFALKRQYGRRKGALAARDMFTDCERIRTDMAHLAAVLAMFEPDADLDAIPPIRPYKPHRGRWNRTALAILRKANRPLKAFELARLVMSAQDIPPDRRTLASIGYSLQAVLARLPDASARALSWRCFSSSHSGCRSGDLGQDGAVSPTRPVHNRMQLHPEARRHTRPSGAIGHYRMRSARRPRRRK